MLTSLMVIYLFICVSHASYVGQTERQLSTQIREYHPRRPIFGQTESIDSAILTHLVYTEHKVNSDTAFKVVYCVHLNKYMAVQLRTLSTVETIDAKWLTPTFVPKSL